MYIYTKRALSLYVCIYVVIKIVFPVAENATNIDRKKKIMLAEMTRTSPFPLLSHH